jgi:RNA recognition motif-containing protein
MSQSSKKIKKINPNCLHITGFKNDVSIKELKQRFEDHVRLRLAVTKSGRLIGFGFVEFKTNDAAKLSLENNSINSILNDRRASKLKISYQYEKIDKTQHKLMNAKYKLQDF